MAKFFSWTILALILATVRSQEIATCTTDETEFLNYTLTTDYMRFKSPGFPATMYNGSDYYPACNAIFMANDTNDYLWLAFINGAMMQMRVTDLSNNDMYYSGFNTEYEVVVFSSTTGDLSFQMTNNFNSAMQWTAFDAVVLPFSSSTANNSCPFDGQTITMYNDTVIPIASDFSLQRDISTWHNCTWKFLVDDPDYQLKVLIKQFAPWNLPGSAYTELIVSNGTDANAYNYNITDYISSNTPKVYYFPGSEITMDLSYLQRSFENNAFMAIVSVVSTNEVYTESCQFMATESLVTVTNLDFVNGYGPYTSCSFNIPVPDGYEVIAEVSEYWIEQGADTLSVNKDWNDSIALGPGGYQFKRAADEAVVDFFADGNTQQAGFTFNYWKIKCECAPSNFVLPCYSAELFPMVNNVSNYCDNMDCEYTISLDDNCGVDYLLLTPSPYFRSGLLDYLELHVNGELYANYTDAQEFASLIFSRSDNITAVFHSGQSLDPVGYGNSMWYILTLPVSTPNFTRYDVNVTNPTLAIWLDTLPQNDAITVCSSTGDLEIFITNGINLEYYDLYDSDGFLNFTSSLDAIASNNFNAKLGQATSNSGCFTIYHSQALTSTGATLYFRIQQIHTQNCNGTNVFGLSNFGPSDNSISVGATPDGPCELIVFSDARNFMEALMIDSIQTSPNTVFPFTSPLNGNPFFELKSEEATYWSNTRIYSPALSIMISANEQFSINFTQVNSAFIFDSNANTKGIFNSLGYSGATLRNDNYNHELYSISLNSVADAEFVVKMLSPSAVVMLQTYNHFGSTNYTFKANDVYRTTNLAFDLYAHQHDPFLIEYSFSPVNTVVASTTETPESSESPASETSPTGTPSATATVPIMTSTITGNSAVQSIIEKGTFVAIFLTFVLRAYF